MIVSVTEAVKTAPTLSGAVLYRKCTGAHCSRHNRPSKTIPPNPKQCVKRRVYRVRKEMTQQQLTDSARMTLLTSCPDLQNRIYSRSLWASTAIARISIIFDFLSLLCSAVKSLLNAILCAPIIAGWEFESNGAVTSKLSRSSFDLFQFCVNSMPKQNNVLCLAIIPKGI